MSTLSFFFSFSLFQHHHCSKYTTFTMRPLYTLLLLLFIIGLIDSVASSPIISNKRDVNDFHNNPPTPSGCHSSDHKRRDIFARGGDDVDDHNKGGNNDDCPTETATATATATATSSSDDWADDPGLCLGLVNI